MKKCFLIFGLILLTTTIRLHAQSTVESKKTVIDFRGQYEASAEIDRNDLVPMRNVYNAKYVLNIGSDDKANSCEAWIMHYRQEYNPNLVRNMINLSNNYNWDQVDGTTSRGTYKINPIDSSVTFTWNKYEPFKKGKLKVRESGLVVLEMVEYNFVKEFDFDGEEYTRSKGRLAQQAFDKKKEEEEIQLKKTKDSKERDDFLAIASADFKKSTELKVRFDYLDSMNKIDAFDYFNDLDRIKEQKVILEKQISGYKMFQTRIDIAKNKYIDGCCNPSTIILDIPKGGDKYLTDLDKALYSLLNFHKSTIISARKFEKERVIKSIVENPRETKDYYLSNEFYLHAGAAEEILNIIGGEWRFATFKDIKKIGVKVVEDFNNETLVFEGNSNTGKDWEDLKFDWKKLSNVKQPIYSFKHYILKLEKPKDGSYWDAFYISDGKPVKPNLSYNEKIFGFFIKSKK
jgi:hypothetical protein